MAFNIGRLFASGAAPAWYITGVLFLCWACSVFDRLILLMLMPDIRASLDVSDTQVSLLHGFAFSMFYAVAGVVLGRYIDRANRRNLIVMGVIGWSLSTAACGLSTNFEQLFVARTLVGLSQAVLMPASLSIVMDYAPPDKRGRTIAILIAGATVGTSAAKVLGGLSLEYFNANGGVVLPVMGVLEAWQSTFFVAGLPGLLLAALLFTVPEPARTAVIGDSRFNALAHIGGNWRTFLPLYLAFTLLMMAAYGLSAWYPTVYMRILAIAPGETGFIVGGMNLIAAGASAFIGGALSDFFAKRDPYTGRIKFAGICMLLNALAIGMLLVPTPISVTASLLFYCIFTGFATSAAYTILPELAPNEGRGQVVAGFQLIGYIFGLGMAPTIIAIATDQGFQDDMKVHLSMVALGVPAMIGAIALLALAAPFARSVRRSLDDAGAPSGSGTH